jgi:hypothetical protein
MADPQLVREWIARADEDFGFAVKGGPGESKCQPGRGGDSWPERN